MADTQNNNGFFAKDGGKTKSNAVEIPSISLPKGGGAIKGIDEKFGVNAANGTASFSIPIPASASRGVKPALNLSYNSGSGNGIFGLGWNLDLPSIKRKTDKGLPKYLDAEDSDVFLFSGGEDLIPEFKKNPDGTFVLFNGEYVINDDETIDADFIIRSYKPRTEGVFARIERWTSKISGETKWKVITPRNIVTLFGWSDHSRITDATGKKTFEWLPEYVFDDRGNCSQYCYQKEDAAGIGASALHNRNRVVDGQISYTNHYPEKILYGNKTPYYRDQASFPEASDYVFSTIFDYGQYNPASPFDKVSDWDSRLDAFSDYRAGFEIRTTRICKRILLFHHFEDTEYNGLVKSLDFGYSTAETMGFSLLETITQRGYIKKNDGSYSQKSLPPVAFQYQAHAWDDEIKCVESESLTQLPSGLDEHQYQFTDLYNEGLSGILTEQGNAWYYKPNLGGGTFAPAKLIAAKPSLSAMGNQLQLADLDADGGKQFISSSPGAKGYFELDDNEQWQQFQAFAENPNIDLSDPNIRMLDLSGDGKPDVLLTEENVFTWYESMGKLGFSKASKTTGSFDEEKGPFLAFTDAHHSIYLADMSGDGLTDIVRIRNREICYWPNLGYGRFGAKVSMDNPPYFDHPDVFNAAYIRLADIDGSGTADIIYLGKNKFSCWKNLSGNQFNPLPYEIDAFPEIHLYSRITITDLFGNGVPCIVWSGLLAKDAQSPLRYIDLMSGKKPHIMIGYENNFGKKVTIAYKPSTYFYLEDKNANRPWITKLHFPVHCVAETVTTDVVSGSRFVNSYKYHHGYYDHTEREFRGFGMVEQIDSEHFEHWEKGVSNLINQELHQEPVISKTWFHTGAFVGREKILRQFEQEYWQEEMRRHGFDTTDDEITLPDGRVIAAPNLPESIIDGMDAVDWQQALRACRSMVLRTETFANDAARHGNTAEARKKALTPYSVATHNCVIELIQPRGKNKYAVYAVRESESVTYSYERDVADPRLAHNLNLEFDAYGNVLESVVVVYPRKQPDLSLPAETREAQAKTTMIYTRNEFTNDIIEDDIYRLRMPSETKTFELKGVVKPGAYYTLKDCKGKLLDANSTTAAYHEIDLPLTTGMAQKRLIEHVQITYYNAALTEVLPLHRLGPLAFAYQNCQLAFTAALVSDLFGTKVNDALMAEGQFVNHTADGSWWVSSGITQFVDAAAGETIATAKNRFFVPVTYTDPFGSPTKVAYDHYKLSIIGTNDAFENTFSVERFNYRTLLPQRMKDLNNNLSEAIADELGLVKAIALMGKDVHGDGSQYEADDLSGQSEWATDTEKDLIRDFLTAPDTVAPEPAGIADSEVLVANAKALLGRATTRFVYNFDTQPAVAASILREEHANENPGAAVQLRFEYSNGHGQVEMTKVQAEPGKAKKVTLLPADEFRIDEIDTAALPDRKLLRWIGNGRKIQNNKGNPVKQYEPYFSVNHRYENFRELVESGVTPIMYYDAVGRLVKTEMPNRTFSKSEFDSWKQLLYDTNDTVTESEWYLSRTEPTHPYYINDPKEEQAALQAAVHYDTPLEMHFDTLGRAVLQVENNGLGSDGNPLLFRTRIEVDPEGNLRKITNARELPENENAGNPAIEYKYDMLGNLVYQNSPDSGQRWQLANCLDLPLRSWDERDYQFSYRYDSLHRPIESRIVNTVGNPGDPILDHIFERCFYGEDLMAAGTMTKAELQAKNLMGQAVRHFDTAGALLTPGYNFKGEPISTTRKLFGKYKEVANWTDANLATDLEPGDGFSIAVKTDALGRMTQQVMPDKSVTNFFYNQTGLLSRESVNHFSFVSGGYEGVQDYIKTIEYDEKGQRHKIIYGNDVTTKFEYDRETFRLVNLSSRQKDAANLLQDLKYTYDPVGNITAIEDQSQPVQFFSNEIIKPVNTFRYDALYRLKEATGRENNAALAFGENDNWGDIPFLSQMNMSDPLSIRNYTQNYEYDAVGNILQMRHTAANGNWTRDYAYEKSNNRLKSTKIGNNGSPADYTDYTHHSTHGFMVALPHLEQIDWNFKEELVKTVRQKVTNGGTAETTYYQYDSQGQRLRKITENQAAAGNLPTKKDERIYIAGYETYRTYKANVVQFERESLSLIDASHRFVMIETVRQNNATPAVLSETVGTRISRYQLHNHLGSATIELNGEAEIISYEEYHPFGTTAYQANNANIKIAAKRYRYTGMERDEETGLEYHNARYYLPWLGRWLSADPIGIEDGVNVYAYAKNNPIICSDHSGLYSDYDEMPSQILNVEEEMGRACGLFNGESHSVLDGVVNSIVALGSAIGDAVMAVGSAISATIDIIGHAIAAAASWIKDAIVTAAVAVAHAVKDAIVAAWEGIKTAAVVAWEGIKTAASAIWNWVLAPLIRTAVNAAVGFAIGASGGSLLGGIIGGSVGAFTGAMQGWAMASAHSYDWGSLGGWVSFIVDNTWSAPNSAIGSLFATINIIGGNPIDTQNSRDSNALMFQNGWFPGYATTLGNVMVGTGGQSAGLLRHESAHILQARLFGPIFYPSMIAHYVINTILPYWLLYHNWRYPNSPIDSFGAYFTRGVYPHTWAEEWGYAVWGDPG